MPTVDPQDAKDMRELASSCARNMLSTLGDVAGMIGKTRGSGFAISVVLASARVVFANVLASSVQAMRGDKSYEGADRTALYLECGNMAQRLARTTLERHRCEGGADLYDDPGEDKEGSAEDDEMPDGV